MISRSDYDDVNGIIIGGEYVGWQVFYGGRPQSQKCHAATEAQALEQAQARIAELERENKPIGLYANPALWEVRLY